MQSLFRLHRFFADKVFSIIAQLAFKCLQNTIHILHAAVVYEKSIGTKMNDFGLCLEVVLRSCQPLRHIRR